MKLAKAVLLPLLLMVGWGGGRSVAAPIPGAPQITADSSLFELDTRGDDGAFSSSFTLDTRDLDIGTSSEMFTLDTRGDILPQTLVFTLDTRGWDALQSPTNFTLVPEQLTVLQLTWDYYGSPLGFNVQRRPPLGEWVSTSVDSGSVRAWVDRTVLAGQFYEYRIAANHTGGMSDYSEIARLQMPSYPAAPQALALSLAGELAMQLDWQDASHNEDGFEVWRRVGTAGNWIQRSVLASNVSSWVDAELSASTPYAFKVRAFNRWGFSAFCDAVWMTTPAGSGGCGYSITVAGATLALDQAFAVTGSVYDADSRALLKGSLSALVTSPDGNPHPVRVVLGFRDGQGRAVGSPVQLMDFYGLPGCPGLLVDTLVPEGFRAPASGTNTLWLEMIMAQRDPVTAFLTERHTQEAPMRKRLFDVRIRAASESVALSIRPAAGTVGELLNLPVQMVSAGGESAVSFSVAIDERLSLVRAEVGGDALQGQLQVLATTNGVTGIALSTPAENPLAPGSKHLVTLVCLANQSGTGRVDFADSPVARALAGGGAESASVTWAGCSVAIGDSGEEGDVSPALSGDGEVNQKDIRLAQQVVLGLQPMPPPGLGFQRMDCAPVATGGDGVIDMADVVAIRAYASGDTAPHAAWGPSEAGGRAPSLQGQGLQLDASLTTVHFEAPANVQRGSTFMVPVVLTSEGDVHGLSLSIAFDASVLAFEEVNVVGSATNGVFLPNVEHIADGVAAFCVTLPSGDVFTNGAVTLAALRFQAMEGIGVVTTRLAFAQSPAETMASGLGAEVILLDVSDSQVSVYDDVAASAPYPPASGVAEGVSMSQIKVSWLPAPFSTGYRIRRRVAGETGWSILAELGAQRSVILDNGLAAGVECEYLVSSLNPSGEESTAILLRARTWSGVDHWRVQQFARVDGIDDAADDADPDGDGIPNLLEYQLGTDPWGFNNQVFTPALESIFAGTRSPTVSYVILNDAPGNVSFESIRDLSGGSSWTNYPLAPVVRRREGSGEHVKMRLPDAAQTNRMIFLRMRAE